MHRAPALDKGMTHSVVADKIKRTRERRADRLRCERPLPALGSSSSEKPSVSTLESIIRVRHVWKQANLSVRLTANVGPAESGGLGMTRVCVQGWSIDDGGSRGCAYQFRARPSGIGRPRVHHFPKWRLIYLCRSWLLCITDSQQLVGGCGCERRNTAFASMRHSRNGSERRQIGTQDGHHLKTECRGLPI
jgi:hypothetical protein